jgi:ligand-binding sensor domain-containing protein
MAISKTGKFILVSVMLLMMHAHLVAQLPLIQKVRVNVQAVQPVFTKAVQDANGYIWLGSDKGLFCYDGISFQQYFPEGDTGEFRITALHGADDGTVWIGCRNGRIYRFIKGSVTQFEPEEGTAGQAISDIIIDGNGIPWWSTTGEGIYYSREGKVYNINHDDGLNDDYVYDLECDSTGTIWAGTDAGIASCRIENGQKQVRPLDASIHLPDIIVRVIRTDRAGRLWLGFQDGGAGFLPGGKESFITYSETETWPYGPVQDISASGDAAWVATADGDLLEINPAAKSIETRKVNRENIRFGKIYDLLEDLEGNLWILANTGLYRSSGNRLQCMEKAGDISLENIHALRNDQDNPDGIWFSNDKGLFYFDIETGRTKRYLENFKAPVLKVMSIFLDKQGYAWAGTFNYGVFRISPRDGSWKQITESQGLVNNNVLSISRHVDTLWMATLGGASEVVINESTPSHPFTISSQNLHTGLVNNFIYSVYEDPYDQIWFATDGDGISVKTKKGWVIYNEKNGLDDDVIYSITGDRYGNIWIATASKGVYKFSDGKFTRYGLQEGLSSLDITSIATLEDELVVVNDNGMDIIHIPTGKVAHYGEESGLAGISPDLNAVSKDVDGNLWIGTRTGLIRYQNGQATSAYGPQTVLEEMSVYLEPREMEDNLVLGYNNNHISFKFAGLWFSNPEKVIYQVFLQGYDLGWKDTYDRQVTYSSLPPGKYTFKIRSSIDKSFINASEASYSFRIRGPFWLNPWFIIFILAILAAVIYLVIRYREEKLRRIEQEKKEIVEFEFQVLKNQVNPHFLFNSFSTLMSLIEDDPDQALKYTEKLSDFFRTILQFKDSAVIKLEDEIALVESYFFLMKKRYGDNLNLEISLGDRLKSMFIPPMTMQILIENAIKHNIISKEKPLFIKIYEDDGKIIVENNLQPKMMVEVSTGIGLQNIRKRYRLITKEEPVMEMTEEYFRVKLPEIK